MRTMYTGCKFCIFFFFYFEIFFHLHLYVSFLLLLLFLCLFSLFFIGPFSFQRVVVTVVAVF